MFDGHLSLNRATYMAEQAVVGPFMWTALTHWKSEDQYKSGNHCGHSRHHLDISGAHLDSHGPVALMFRYPGCSTAPSPHERRRGWLRSRLSTCATSTFPLE